MTSFACGGSYKMIKYICLLVCLLVSDATAIATAEEIETLQTELYVVAGILGGACLLLTIATIYNSVTILGLLSKVAVLQAAGNATIKAVATAAAETSPPSPRNPYDSRPPPPLRRDDPYRRPESRGDYR